MSPEIDYSSALRDWVELFMRRSMHNYIRYAQDSGLSMSQVGALFHIHHRGPTGVGDLGDHLGVSNAAASQLLDRLVQQGLVTRLEDPADRRAKRIALTEAGRQVVRESIHARQAWLYELADTLSPDEQALVARALSLLTEKIRRSDASAGDPSCTHDGGKTTP